MSNNRKWIAIFLVVCIAGFFATYFIDTDEITPKKDNLVVTQSNVVTSTSNIQPTEFSNEQSLAKNLPLKNNDLLENPPLKRTPITPAEQEVNARWQLTLGRRPYGEYDPYEHYDLETLKKLASHGDIFALVEGSKKMWLKNREDLAFRMLNDASMRGSTTSLLWAGGMLESTARNVTEGRVGKADEAKIRKDFRLKDNDEPLKNLLYRSATAHYLVAAIRGDRLMAEQYIELIQKRWVGRPFTNREWQIALSDAKALYEHLSKAKEKRGLGKFDNSYPIEYAKVMGYPKENNFLEELKAKYKNSL